MNERELAAITDCAICEQKLAGDWAFAIEPS